jgi:tight adherence protein C
MTAIPLLAALPLLLVLLHFGASSRVRRARIMRRLHKLEQITDAAEGTGSALWQTWLRLLALPLAGAGERNKLQERLLAAAYRKQWHVDAFLLLKLGLFLCCLFAGWHLLDMRFAAILKRPLDAGKYLLLLFLAARLPDWWLAGQVSARRARIRATVPQAVDLMTICVEAGSSLDEAFGRVAAEVRPRAPEIASEFSLTRSEMLVMDRSEALRRLERRSRVREIESLASSLLQSIRYGTPIADALRIIAQDSRARQVSELEEKAGRIAARISIPLILLILFPLVGLIAAPALINLMRSLQS